MISETPCRPSKPKATGISRRTGQRISPPGSDEYSWISNELTSEGQLYQPMMIDGRQQHEDAAEDVDPRLCARREPAADHVDAHVLVAPQRIGRDQQEHRGIEIPLQLEPGVGADVERVARDRVAGADDHRGKPEPGHRLADSRIDVVDDAGKAKQRVHASAGSAVRSRASLSKRCGKRKPQRRKREAEGSRRTICVARTVHLLEQLCCMAGRPRTYQMTVSNAPWGTRGMAVAPHSLAAESAIGVLREGRQCPRGDGRGGCIHRRRVSRT